MSDSDPGASRAGWSLTTERIEKDPDGLDLDAIFDRIEKESGIGTRTASVDDEFCVDFNRYSPSQSPKTRLGNRRKAWYLPRLPVLERLHLAVCAYRDQRIG